MKNEDFTFIYKKENTIKVLTLDEIKKQEEQLLRDGWVHTSTLDACMFIEYIYNEYSSKLINDSELIELIQALGKK